MSCKEVVPSGIPTKGCLSTSNGVASLTEDSGLCPLKNAMAEGLACGLCGDSHKMYAVSDTDEYEATDHDRDRFVVHCHFGTRKYVTVMVSVHPDVSGVEFAEGPCMLACMPMV